MAFRSACLILCLLNLAQITIQQSNSKPRQKPTNSKKDVVTMQIIDEIKKQINDIAHDVNLLKEQQALQTICFKGFKVQNKCFLPFSQAKTYHEANNDCMAQGGILSTPENGDENDSLYEYMRKILGSEKEVWIGINDMANEGTWVDMSGSSISFKNWETEITTQPDGGKQENCAALSGVANGKWFDKKCRNELPFICQFVIV
ncbi:tetranectin-like [Microcaecilia unicolor]|uniref:Tetranectin-like n=1 Tax=Microcaecilia unicolor TaxID=1415580 RepID=A0A6P7WXI3_9AMPH|nr:tetranectin-like [Microcaecilia unicolor]